VLYNLKRVSDKLLKAYNMSLYHARPPTARAHTVVKKAEERWRIENILEEYRLYRWTVVVIITVENKKNIDDSRGKDDKVAIINPLFSPGAVDNRQIFYKLWLDIFVQHCMARELKYWPTNR